jgi:hypothetical protein
MRRCVLKRVVAVSCREIIVHRSTRILAFDVVEMWLVRAGLVRAGGGAKGQPHDYE